MNIQEIRKQSLIRHKGQYRKKVEENRGKSRQKEDKGKKKREDKKKRIK